MIGRLRVVYFDPALTLRPTRAVGAATGVPWVVVGAGPRFVSGWAYKAVAAGDSVAAWANTATGRLCGTAVGSRSLLADWVLNGAGFSGFAPVTERQWHHGLNRQRRAMVMPD